MLKFWEAIYGRWKDLEQKVPMGPLGRPSREVRPRDGVQLLRAVS
jgi:hypothetical protein